METMTVKDNIKIVIEGKEYILKKGIPLKELFQKVGIKGAIGGKIGDKIVDLQTPLSEEGEVKPLFKRDPESLEILRHSLAHILAQALKELYGAERVHLGIGPPTEEGFYYDVEVEGHQITEEDLKKIEEKMKEIIRRNYSIERETLERSKALDVFEKLKEKYKLDIINRIPPEEEITVYKQGEFIDLCKGPHLPSTGEAGAFKLISVSGAYWQGRADQPQLTRIYGLAFWTEKELKQRLKFYEEAKKRDHRKIGKELEFFIIEESVGAGLILWLPRGAVYRNVLEDYWRKEHFKRGYKLVYTPHVGKARLWQKSGHLEYYKENMFPPMKVEGEEYYVKPMNCPFHITIYKSKTRSYKELPLKLAELGTVYRYEMSGVLHGLMRVRGFTQDDAHIICAPDQVEGVIEETLSFALSMLKDFGFEEFKIYISTKPEDAIGSEEQWKLSEDSLKKAVEKLNHDYELDEGGGAFYGPKIDIKIKDAIGRLWQCSTIQFDFNLPERFDMTYIGPDNKKHRPYMIHRALLGSVERFTGILLEHHAGQLPLWLSPTQIRIVPIADRHKDYGLKILSKLIEENFRADMDERDERMNAKIRDAELLKIPYILVIGDKEVETGRISVRSKKKGNMGSMELEEFMNLLKEEIRRKK